MIKLFEKINKAPPGKKRLYYSLLSVSSVVFIAIVILALYVGRVYYIKTLGISLVPTKNYDIPTLSYYRQNDPAWQDEKIGDSQKRMGGTGCLISCVSTAISQLDEPVTPKEFNERLTQVSGFQGADLIWYKINEAFPNIGYRYSRTFSNRIIESDLKKGLLPIVNVKYHKTGITHWVIIVGANEGEFIICDPLDDGHSTRLLSDHGKVYAYRVIERVNE
ncbi:MAG: C39 family peptidase [Thermoclostridium sp.]|nr:C39 family peptidase [Thermoclostridium sp.]